MDSKPAIVRHIKSDAMYEYRGDNKYRNLITGVDGEVEPDKAKDIFVVNLLATHVMNEYPLVKELVSKLKLKIDKT